MNTKSCPSRYRYCISWRSTMARPTFTPALNVRSITAPVLTLRSLVRTNAPPLPGFTCWNSTIWKSVPSRSRVMPRFRSFVLTLTATYRPRQLSPEREGGSQHHQFLRRSGHHPSARRSDLDHVLDADSPHAVQVDPRLHGHHGPLRKDVGAGDAQRGALVDLQPNSVPQRVLELIAVPGLGDDVASSPVCLRPGHPRSDRVHSGLLSPADDLVDLFERWRGPAQGH